MSSPQLEDGYVRIANELLDAILAFDFSKREMNVVFAVIRKTYGYGKKADDLSLSQLHEITGIDSAHLSRAVRDLAAKKVLLIQQGRFAQSIGINKKYVEWKVLPKQQQAIAETATCQKSKEGVAETATSGLPKEQPQKTTPKDNSKRKVYEAEFDQEIRPWYPKRAGGNAWPAARKAYCARRADGHSMESIKAGTIRYALYCETERVLRTRFVKQASTFYGPDEHFSEEWEASNETNQHDSPADRVRRANGL